MVSFFFLFFSLCFFCLIGRDGKILGRFGTRVKPDSANLDSGAVDFTGGDDGQILTAAVAEEFRRVGWGAELTHFVDTKPLSVPELEKSADPERRSLVQAGKPVPVSESQARDLFDGAFAYCIEGGKSWPPEQ